MKKENKMLEKSLEMRNPRTLWVPSSKKKKIYFWDMIEVVSIIGSGPTLKIL